MTQLHTLYQAYSVSIDEVGEMLGSLHPVLGVVG